MANLGSPSHTPDTESSFETTIISSLAVYTKGSGKKAKEVKAVKVNLTLLFPMTTTLISYMTMEATKSESAIVHKLVKPQAYHKFMQKQNKSLTCDRSFNYDICNNANVGIGRIE